MIDFILFIFVLAVFYAGLWTGKTYGTFKAALAAAYRAVSSWFN